MIALAHAAIALLAAATLARALQQSWVAELAADEAVRDTLRWLLPALVIAGSALAIAIGRATARPWRALAADLASLFALWCLVFIVSLGPLSRDAAGALVVLALAARVAWPLLSLVTRVRSALLAFGIALVVYASAGAWLVTAALPYGDQVHYLLVADALSRGDLDATIDAAAFRSLIGTLPSVPDVATHVAATPRGPRPIQGHALALIVLPGWLLAGRLGAHLVLAFVAAFAAAQTYLLLRDVLRRRRLAGIAWALVALLPPFVVVAPYLYPNALGAALVVTAYRYAFTAERRRPALAAAFLASTLFLSPRDGMLAVALAPFAFIAADRATRRRIALATGAVALAAVAYNAVLYGMPVPYAGYFIGTEQGQAIEQKPSIDFAFWVGLPGILVDRTFGLVAVAPHLLLALLGLRRAWRDPRLRPAGVAIVTSLGALSLFRLWSGGYAPPARYLVDALPLLAPFLAYGLAASARAWPLRAFATATVAMAALAALLLLAMPTRALNGPFDDQLREAVRSVIGLDLLGWLPSFIDYPADWYVAAYTRLVPAVALFAGLTWLGVRGVPTVRMPPWPLAYALAVGVLMVFVLIGAAQQPAAPQVHLSLVRRWLPFALALFATLTAAIATQLRPPARARVLSLSLLVFAAQPVALLLLRHSQVVPGQLGSVLMLAIVAGTVVALRGLWLALPRLSDRRAAFALAAVALAAFLALLPYHRTVMPTAADEPHYLLIVQSLLYDRDLDLRNDYEGDRYLAFYPARLPDMHGIEVGRAVYPIRDLGLPVISVIPFAIAGRSGVLALVCALAALLVAQCYLALRDLGVGRRVAFVAICATALVHPFLTYTTQVYPELAAALVLVTVARVLRHGERLGPRDLALASALTALLPALSTRAWLIAVGLGLAIAYWAFRSRTGALPARLAAGALPFTAGAFALSAINWAMLGVFLPSAGYFLIRDQQQVLTWAPHVGGIGLLLDRVFGLVGRAPLYLLALVGLPALWRHARAGGGALISALALGWGAYFLYVASIAYWWADGSPPSRYLVASLPFLIVAVACGLETIARAGRAVQAVAGALVGASVFITFVYAVAPNLRYDIALIVRASGSNGELWPVVGRVVRPDVSVVLPSIVHLDPTSLALIVVWLAVAVALVYAGLRLERRGRSSPAR